MLSWAQSCQGAHCLRTMGVAKPSPGETHGNANAFFCPSMIVYRGWTSVCRPIGHRFLLHDYSLRVLTYRDLLERLDKPASLFIRCLKINMLRFSTCGLHHSEHTPTDASLYIHMHVCILFLLHQLGQPLKTSLTLILKSECGSRNVNSH